MPSKRETLQPPLAPMECRSVETIPRGDRWQYEPKWDGFRCVAFRDGAEVYLQSKSGQPLARYFPEVVAMLRGLDAERFVLDGELYIEIDGVLSFDDLLQRIHPAESRVKKLAREMPASYVVFDLLADGMGASLLERPLRERRAHLDAFAGRYFGKAQRLRVSPATTDRKVVDVWLARVGNALDGVIAKALDEPYRSGERSGCVKIKHLRTADCVVGGYRLNKSKNGIGSILLGLYDDGGRLHHVGFSSGFREGERKALLEKLKPLVEEPGFTGSAPGGPSRWNPREEPWFPLRPSLVVEVSFDHITGARFRHGTKVLRWRPDKAPSQCTMEQLEQKEAVHALEL